jgi:hypothetical protein
VDEESPAGVTPAFLKRFSDGEFDEADELIHPEGPLEGAGDVAMVFSMLLTDFLATLVLRSIPTEVTETTVVEEGPTRASVAANVDVADVATVDASVELRPGESDETSDRGVGRGTWRVWNVDLDV